MTERVASLTSEASVAKVRFGQALQRVRKSVGMNGTELAKLINRSQSHVSKIETGRIDVDELELQLLIDALSPSEEDRANLLTLHALIRTPEDNYRYIDAAGIDLKQKEILEYEKRAARVEEFEIGFVPGLLQTRLYSTSILQWWNLDRDRIDSTVETRIRRQDILRDTRRKFVFILPESVLYTVVGTRKIQAEQLQWIHTVMGHPNVRVGIVPSVAGLPPTALSGFVIYNGSFVTCETVASEQVFRDRKDLNWFAKVHATLCERALFDDNARQLIQRAIDHFSTVKQATA